MVTLSPAALSAITGLVLPLLVGLVTKSGASARVKVATHLVVGAAAALLLNAVNAEGYASVSWDMLGAWAQQTAIGIATYLGVLKPLDVPAYLAPQRGLGAVAAAPVAAAPVAATRQGGAPLPSRRR